MEDAVTLAQRSCQPCRGATDRMDTKEREILLKAVPDWSVREEDGTEQLRRSFGFGSYREGLAFVRAVAELAESEDHHPRLILEWGKVTVDWWTHTLGGLHLNDFILAARCDELYGRGKR